MKEQLKDGFERGNTDAPQDAAVQERFDDLVFEGSSVVAKNGPKNQLDDDWEAELIVLKAWQWDGHAICDITDRLELINIHMPNKRKQWAHTVPADCHGKVFYVESKNPVNSEEEVRRYAEILAVDESMNALVFKTYYNTYTDDEAVESTVMSIANAKALIHEYQLRKAQQDMLSELEVEVADDDVYASSRPSI